MSKTEDRLEQADPDPHASDAEALGDAAKRLPLAAYVPMGVTSRYAPPKATVDPDRSKKWIKRALPILMAHKVHLSVR